MIVTTTGDPVVEVMASCRLTAVPGGTGEFVPDSVKVTSGYTDVSIPVPKELFGGLVVPRGTQPLPSTRKSTLMPRTAPRKQK
jgi:hypothetical protein